MMRKTVLTLTLAICLWAWGCDADTKNVDSCGDGFLDPGEECDGTNLDNESCASLGFYNVAGNLSCSTDCQFITTDCGVARCGDGLIHESDGEQCDGTELGGQSCRLLGYDRGVLSCLPSCRFDLTGCERDGYCGDGTVTAPFEECEGTNLNGGSCSGLGFYQGTLRCSEACLFDTTACVGQCGDGVIQDAFGEACDGLNLDGATCETLGQYPGVLACDTTCRLDLSACGGSCGDGVIQEGAGETCDGEELASQTCTTLGYHDGILACDAGCAFDFTACGGSCGDGIIQTGAGEECDGAALGGVTCVSEGFHGGEPTCGAACRLDLTACEATGYCGDGMIQDTWGETCDSGDLNSETCTSLGYYGGDLLCGPSCAFDLSDCATYGRCGDGVLQGGEICDGANLNGLTCALQGYWGGSISCSASCDPFLANCHAVSMMANKGNMFACALTDDGYVKCWGYNGAGQLGDGTTTTRYTPTRVINVNGANEVHSGVGHACARIGSSVKCWGIGDMGQLGNGSTTNTSTPVSASISNVRSLALGDYHSCVAQTNGNVACWGSHGYGQLGGGYALDSVPHSTPGLAVDQSSNPLTGIASVSAGTFHTCALGLAGTVWCWGRGDSYQLGDGTSTNSPRAKAVPGLTSVVALSSGGNGNCALLTDGTVSCWGGGMGNVPTPVAGLSGVAEVAVGISHACARLTGGQVQCWGSNSYGELGDGTTNPSTGLVTVTVATGVTRIFPGFSRTCVSQGVGRPFCWGRNYQYRLLGNNTTADSLTPVAVLYGN
ncbi:MAG: hypothetical protein CVU59_03895 [Deltaproteobacteria bacterium HGW-Deltaproteobacteria-17]|nr:MAG: hypothetical protein CVU59_03895 [Deltaproteobacteria bacterium HGW-Deltaproteobacteria-17]